MICGLDLLVVLVRVLKGEIYSALGTSGERFGAVSFVGVSNVISAVRSSEKWELV